MSLITRIAAVAIVIASASSALAQTVSIQPLPKLIFCAGEEVEVGYTATGAFTSRNSFTVQISDTNGTFNTFQNIGSKRTAELSGTIMARIPNDMRTINRYRVRLISSEPYAVSADNGANILIGGIPWPRIEEKRHIIELGTPVQLKSLSENAQSLRWDFGPDAIPETSTELEPTVLFTTPGYQKFSLTAISAGGCEVTQKYGETNDIGLHWPAVYVVTCMPKIPSNAFIDSLGVNNYGNEQSIWVVPGGSYGRGPYNGEIFVEPGGSVIGLSYQNVIFLKAGAAAHDLSSGSLIVREPGASLSGRMGSYFFECANLEFDYSDAPPYKIGQASVRGKNGGASGIYPNPASSVFYRTGNERIISARLFSITGQLVMSALEPQGSELFNVSAIPAGLYQLELRYPDRTETQKLVVQR
jgi:hypothetical protein